MLESVVGKDFLPRGSGNRLIIVSLVFIAELFRVFSVTGMRK